MTGSRGRPVVVVDPASASAATIDDLRAAFATVTDHDQVEWADVSTPTDDDIELGASTFERSRRAAARAVASGAPTVIACGHDATVRACVEAVAGTSTAVGVVSLGGGSLLAANMGIEPGLGAVADAVGSAARRIDVGEANGEVFAVAAGFGIDALVGRRGPDDSLTLGAFASGLRRLARRLVPVTVHVDGVHRFTGRSACVLVANCPGGPGRVTLVADADPTDAELDLAVLTPSHPWRWPGVVWRLLTDRAQHPDDVYRCRGEWVFVQTWRPHSYELDGDLRPPASRLDVEVWPAALAVRMPAIGGEPGGEPVDEPAVEHTSNGDENTSNGDAPGRPAARKLPPRNSPPRKATPRKAAARNSAPRTSAPRTTASHPDTRGGPLATEDSDPSTN